MKLSQLTPEQKNRLLAELAGIVNSKGEIINDANWAFYKGHLWSLESDGLPDEIWPILTSYDAIIPLVQKLPLEQYRSVVNLIWQWTDAKVFKATPSQLCDAVLVATGKAEL